MKKDINIKEVARKCGVSIATVSRVFNNSGPVKESTRKKIEKIIEETGYRPNVLARELAEKKTHLVGMIVHSMIGEGLPRTINGVNDVLQQHDFNLLISCSNGSFESEMKHFEIFRSKRVEGILFATREFKKEHSKIIKKLPIPVVVLLQKTSQEKIPYVAFDNYRFAKEATKRLFELGHSKFAFIGGPVNATNAIERQQGFVHALLESGLEVEEALIKNGDYTIEDGYWKMESLLSEKKELTAVVAVNDGMAIGAINCLQDHGVNVPDEISVLGLDDTVLAKALRLKLSGVHYSYTDLGKVGAEILLKQIESNELKFEKHLIPYTIHLRESVARVKPSDGRMIGNIFSPQ
ncbi:LacI family DNA-binding transcriptional regulator [Aneurinibacillus terranovensis]|uniref:LacI family DNA-binding transcriptional regulator n=1 Tax=Aneurinibacillus terranovensis TaxID=278991 RepID=UPI00042850BF|nr:LacI family DNA-binding transcriptional regulator [Aneurinibacillus terranovensis]